jgi:mitotic spindle assembly checkpoint protein MAD2B
VVIRSQADNVALERYVFSMEQLIDVEAYDKDVKFVAFPLTLRDMSLIIISVEGALSPSELGAYFRAFLVKLHMMESNLLPLDIEQGQSCLANSFLDLTWRTDDGTDEPTFAVVIELKDGEGPTQVSKKWQVRWIMPV